MYECVCVCAYVCFVSLEFVSCVVPVVSLQFVFLCLSNPNYRKKSLSFVVDEDATISLGDDSKMM